MQRTARAAAIILLLGLLTGMGSGLPGGENASVEMAATAATPPWDAGDRPDTMKLVGLGTVLVLAVAGSAAGLLHRRDDLDVSDLRSRVHDTFSAD